MVAKFPKKYRRFLFIDLSKPRSDQCVFGQFHAYCQPATNYIYCILAAGADPGNVSRGQMTSVKHEPITGSKAESPMGSKGRTCGPH